MQQANNSHVGLPDLEHDAEIEIGELDDNAPVDELEARGQGRSKRSAISGLFKLGAYGVFGLIFTCLAILIYLKSIPKGNDKMQLVQSQVDIVSGKPNGTQTRREESIGGSSMANEAIVSLDAAPTLSKESVLSPVNADSSAESIIPVPEQSQAVVGNPNSVGIITGLANTVSNGNEKRTDQASTQSTTSDLIRLLQEETSKNTEEIEKMTKDIQAGKDDSAGVISKISALNDRISQIEAETAILRSTLVSIDDRLPRAPIKRTSVQKKPPMSTTGSLSRPSPSNRSIKGLSSVDSPPFASPTITIWGNDKFAQLYVSGAPYEVREGDVVAGWKVLTIQSDSVNVVKVTGGPLVRVLAPRG